MPVEIVFETDALREDKERGIATGWLPRRLRPRGRTNAAAMCDGAATTLYIAQGASLVLSFDSTGDDPQTSASTLIIDARTLKDTENGQQLHAAGVRHYTSRAGDPHRHLHLQINRQTGGWGCTRSGCGTPWTRSTASDTPQSRRTRTSVQRSPDTGHADRGRRDHPARRVCRPVQCPRGQIARHLDRYEAEWRATHPGREPGPALRRAWDARAWADNRPDKVIPAAVHLLRQRWVHELSELGYRDSHRGHGAVPARGAALRVAATRTALRNGDIRP
jgi:hypothetical protein